MPAGLAPAAMIWVAVIQSDQPFGTPSVRLIFEPSLFST